MLPRIPGLPSHSVAPISRSSSEHPEVDPRRSRKDPRRPRERFDEKREQTPPERPKPQLRLIASPQKHAAEQRQRLAVSQTFLEIRSSLTPTRQGLVRWMAPLAYRASARSQKNWKFRKGVLIDCRAE